MTGLRHSRASRRLSFSWKRALSRISCLPISQSQKHPPPKPSIVIMPKGSFVGPSICSMLRTKRTALPPVSSHAMTFLSIPATIAPLFALMSRLLAASSSDSLKFHGIYRNKRDTKPGLENETSSALLKEFNGLEW